MLVLTKLREERTASYERLKNGGMIENQPLRIIQAFKNDGMIWKHDLFIIPEYKRESYEGEMYLSAKQLLNSTSLCLLLELKKERQTI